MKVLLILESAVEKSMYINVLPPLGILGIASYLISKSIDTKVIDCNIEDYNYENIEKYDVIGFSLFCSNITKTFNAAKKIKNKFPNKKVIIGGPHTLTNPEEFIKKDYIDAVFIGESEHSLYEFLTSKDLTNIQGVYFKENNKIKFNGLHPFLTDLDSLPFPALDQVKLEKYVFPISKAQPISQIMTSRGCPYSCIYCFHSLGKKWRARSAKNIVDEIEWQVNKLGVKEISISDDNFTLDRKRVEEVCDIIIKRKIKVKIQLMNGIRADKVDKELLKKMKKAGTWLIAVAPETGNEETLLKIKKGMSLECSKNVVKWCKELRISTYAFYMVGFPWETEKHINKTIDFAEKLDTDFTQFSRVLPFEGTELAKMLCAKTDTKNDIGLFYGNNKYSEQKLSDEQTKKLIQKAYKRCYFKPFKMLRILKILSLKNLYLLAKYAFKTESM